MSDQNWWLCALLPRWSWDDGCTKCAGSSSREDDESYETTRIIPEGMNPATAVRTGEYLAGTGIDPKEAI